MTLRSRGILVGLAVLLMTYLAVPSFFSEQTRKDSPWLRDEGMRLGLDLQGGIHWLLRIDENEAIHQELSSVKDALETLAEDRKVNVTSLEIGEDRVLRVSGDLPALRRLLDEQFSDVNVTESGGQLEITLPQARIDRVVDTAVSQAVEVLNRRIDKMGVTEPVIAPQGRGRILVQMPGEVDPERARDALKNTTFLEFYKVLDAAPNVQLLNAKYEMGLPEKTKIVTQRSVASDPNSVTEAYLVPEEAVLNGTMLQDARLGFDRRNRPIILFTWNADGTRIFRDFTAKNIGERLAAVIDQNVITAPVIQSRIGRNGQISGNFTREEAALVAVSLRSGALPIPLKIEEERSVGPALGADSIREGVRSIVLGGVLVIVFMAIYYSVAGVLANVALIVNLIIIVGLMSLAQATLTLPGIAGLVLTIGMAVDANVIIFERIREELRRHKNPRNAIQIGFRRSSLTILDANVTTLIAAVVLLYFGRGPVQGFGVTLAIGIFSSVFCALVVTRLLFDLVYARNPNTVRI